MKATARLSIAILSDVLRRVGLQFPADVCENTAWWLR
jgi:hypothetical protein